MLQSLEVFRAVARHGSITAAARSLRYSQSTISRQITALENDLDAVLFDRLPRGVALTEEGRCLLPHAEAMLDRLTSAHQDLALLRGLGGGRLRVGAFPTAVAALVPRALAAFRSDHPDVRLSLVEGRTPQLLDGLLAGDADVVVVSAAADEPLDATRFDLHHLLDEELLVAVPRQHRLARRRVVRLAELAQENFIAGSATAETTLLRATLPSGFQPRWNRAQALFDASFRRSTASLATGGALASSLASAFALALALASSLASALNEAPTKALPSAFRLTTIGCRCRSRSPSIFARYERLGASQVSFTNAFEPRRTARSRSPLAYALADASNAYAISVLPSATSSTE